MREILFRGKRIDNGKWIEGYVFRLNEEGLPPLIMKINQDGMAKEVDPETVGQYIGLTDKNGKKIFEGDIIKYDGKTYEMRYIERYGRFAGKNDGFAFAVVPFGTIEIIGNVYDNPELMNGGESK